MQGGPLVLPMLYEITFVKSFLRRHRSNIHVEYFILGWFEKRVLYTVYLKQVLLNRVESLNVKGGATLFMLSATCKV